MPAPLFQVIAQVTTDDFDLLERVQKGLSRTFGLDLNPYRGELRAAGVCVARAATLPEAEEKAQLARGIGADYRIVDPQNRTVRQGFGRRGEAPPPPGSSRRDDPPTLLGGFNAPAGSPRSPSGMHARVSPRENPALAPTLESVSIGSGAEGPTAEFVRPDPSGELDLLQAESIADTPIGAPSKAPANPASGFNLDALDADDLVLLDGSREEPRPSKSGLLKQSSAAELAFAPPTADEELEIEELAQTAPPPSRAPSQPLELLPDPEPVDDLPEVAALAKQALVLDRSATAPRAAPATSPPRPPSETQRSARRTAPAAPAVKLASVPGRLLLGGWFRARPRLRILVGFVLALGLGSIVPSCHARSVLRARVTPQLEDLSTAKAHGHLLSRLPGYRSPEAIEEEISSIKTRGKVLSFALWLLIGGGLGFAWFRFT